MALREDTLSAPERVDNNRNRATRATPMKLILKLTTGIACGLMFLGGPTGCAVFKAVTTPVSVQTTTKIIVDAEKTAQIGIDAERTFLALEERNRAAFLKLSTKPHEFSVWLREPIVDGSQIILPGGDGSKITTKFDGLSGPTHLVPRGVALIQTLRVATKAFEANRSATNQANLNTVYQTVLQVISNCNLYSVTGK